MRERSSIRWRFSGGAPTRAFGDWGATLKWPPIQKECAAKGSERCVPSVVQSLLKNPSRRSLTFFLLSFHSQSLGCRSVVVMLRLPGLKRNRLGGLVVSVGEFDLLCLLWPPKPAATGQAGRGRNEEGEDGCDRLGEAAVVCGPLQLHQFGRACPPAAHIDHHWHRRPLSSR